MSKGDLRSIPSSWHDSYGALGAVFSVSGIKFPKARDDLQNDL